MLLGIGLGEPMATRRRVNIGLSAVLLAFCAAAYALTYAFDAVPQAFLDGLGADLFPRLVLAVMMLLAVLLALGIGAGAVEDPQPVPRATWLTGGVMVVYMAALELIGMWPASFLFLIGLGWLWGERRLWRLAVSALALCAALYAVFVHLFGGTFPSGLLSDLVR